MKSHFVNATIFVLIIFAYIGVAQAADSVVRDGVWLRQQLEQYKYYNSPASNADYHNDLRHYIEVMRASDMITGYLFGTLDSSAYVFTCLPSSVTNMQAVLVIEKYLNNNPKSLQYSAASLIIVAAEEAWPCPTQKPKN